MSNMISGIKKKKRKQLAEELNCHKIESVVGNKLSQLYRGYQWFIECRPKQGVVVVKNLTLHGDYGFIIHLRDLLHDVSLKLVTRAGGELLERCGLPTTHRPEHFKELVKKDIRGNVIGDKHGAT